MEIRHIRYFLAVAEELNITKAAQKLNMGQPPLSRQIKELEKELDAQLFIRRPHGLQLTEAGRQYRSYAQQIIHLIEQSAEDMKELNNGLQGTIYIASVEGHAPHQLSSWISAFHNIYPHVQFSLWNGNSDDVADRISKGLSDLAIIMEPYNHEGFDGLPVYKEPWIAMLPIHHPLASYNSPKLPIKELAPYDLIIPSRNSRLQEINGWFSSLDTEPHIYCRMAHMLNAYELTAQNAGISIYPASASLYIDPDRVCIKELTEPDVYASYVLIKDLNRPLSLVAQEFLDFIKGHNDQSL